MESLRTTLNGLNNFNSTQVRLEGHRLFVFHIDKLHFNSTQVRLEE